MSSQGLSYKAVALLLFFLTACAQSPTGNVVNDAPREVVVNATPPNEVVVNATPGIPEVPEEQEVREEPVPFAGPVPEVIIIPAAVQIQDPVRNCVRGCQLQCDADARTACSQGTTSDCKHKCGGTIDPNACSTACSFRRAGSCVEKFNQFCSAQCEGKCRSG